MGSAVNQLVGQNDDLLSIAALHARDVDALCADVAAIIFPSAIQPPSDAVVNAVSMKLLQLVGDIETKLTGVRFGPGTRPSTWTLLAQSGFLREVDLVDFVLARVCEDRLEARLRTFTRTLPVELLDHSDGSVADAAQLLLAADSLHRLTKGGSYYTLPPELLHKICWRVVAALEVLQGVRSPMIVSGARDIIAAYDERQTATSAARKIVHLLGNEYSEELLDPARSGIHLFIAKLVSETSLDHDHVLRLADCGSIAPLAIILAALEVSKSEALALLLMLSGTNLSTREAAIFDEKYSMLDQVSANNQIASWSLARSNYLAFGTA